MVEGNQRYRLGRALGKGGVAEVFEAIGVDAHGIERRLALKRWLSSDEQQLTAFADEAKVASRLHHPNLVQVLDYGVLDDRPFLALELIDGLDLGELAKRAAAARERLPIELALYVTLEVAHGLAYAHEQRSTDGHPLGIVHRDVSPANILISAGGEVKLGDFGIAWFSDRSGKTAIGTVKGKRSYMAPEQALGESVDARTDLFALGCVLAFALTGDSPLARPEVAEGVLRGLEVPVPTNLPPDLIPLLSKSLARDPARRYKSAHDFAEALGGALYPRIQRDPRGLLRSFVQRFAAERPAPTRTPLEELMDVARILENSVSGLPRFSTTVQARAVPLPPAPQEELQAPTPTDATAANILRPNSLGATLPPTPVAAKPLSTQRIRERKGTIPLAGDAGSDSEDRAGSGEEPDPLIGTVIHGYQLTGVLGRGALARVYRARHLVLAREYAVKILYGRAADNERSKKRLEREAVTLSRLLHPNIVQVVDFGLTDDGRSFLTMELLEGRTISQAVKTDGPFDGPRTASVARQIAAALEHAHAQQVIHRDLKPGNVMLIRQGDGTELVKVLDFGIARLGDQAGTRLTSADSILGTPRYMAPEQIAGAGAVGPAADLYALGTVMYAMLSGRPPFIGKTLEVVEKQLREMPPPLTTETGLEALTFHLLAKSPEDRPPSAAHVIARIDALELAEPVLTVSVDPDATVAAVPEDEVEPTASISITREPASVTPPSLNPPPDRTRGPLLIAFAGLMVAGIVLGFAWTRSRGAVVEAPTTTAVTSPAPPPHPEAPEARAVPSAERAQPTPPPAELRAPPPSRSPDPGPRPNRPPKKEVSLPERLADARRQLAALGLSAEDLSAMPALADAKGRLERAVKGKDEAAAEAAHAELLEQIRTFEPDRELVEAKLRRIAAKLKAAEPKVTPEVFDGLENRYLDALASAKGNPGRSFVRSLQELERAVEQAGP